jgi:hypothetical protein
LVYAITTLWRCVRKNFVEIQLFNMAIDHLYGIGDRRRHSYLIDLYMYNETRLNQTSLEPNFVFSLQDKLTHISYIWTLFKVWFIQNAGLFRVQFRHVSLFIYQTLFYLGHIIIMQIKSFNRNILHISQLSHCYQNHR